MIANNRTEDTLASEEQGLKEGSSAIFLEPWARRGIVQTRWLGIRESVRLQFSCQLPLATSLQAQDTSAKWPPGTGIVIRSGQADWATFIDPSQLGQSRLGVPWSQHLDWFSGQIASSFPVGQAVLRHHEVLQEASSSLTEAGRFPESIWLEQNLDAIQGTYAGLWIAVEGSSVIAVGHAEVEALEQAARVGHDSPYTCYVPREGEPAPMA